MSATNGNFPIFDGVSGKQIKSSAFNSDSFALKAHDHDGVYPKKYTTTLGASTSQIITHNLNTRDVTLSIRETNSPYAQVVADVEFTSVNTVTVKTAVAPIAGQYTITIVG